MVMTYQAAVLRVAYEFYADVDEVSADARDIRLLSYIYGVRPERIVADIHRAHDVLEEE